MLRMLSQSNIGVSGPRVCVGVLMVKPQIAAQMQHQETGCKNKVSGVSWKGGCTWQKSKESWKMFFCVQYVSWSVFHGFRTAVSSIHSCQLTANKLITIADPPECCFEINLPFAKLLQPSYLASTLWCRETLTYGHYDVELGLGNSWKNNRDRD